MQSVIRRVVTYSVSGHFYVTSRLAGEERA